MPTVKKIKKPSKKWFNLDPPVKVYTDDGVKECKRFYFNGFEPVYALTFVDNNVYECTANHSLKDVNDLWVKVSEIESGFVANNNVVLVKKEYVGVMPTMDMEVPDVHYYVLSNGVHSHNSSFILGQVSEGIEPATTNYDTKDTAKGKFSIRNVYLQKLLEDKGFGETEIEEIWLQILKAGGSVQNLSCLTDHEKQVFKTFAEISPKEIIIQAAQRQKYIDQSQSLNLMIHPTIPIKEVNALIIEAWKMGVKSLYYQKSVNAAQTFSRNIMNCTNCEA